MNFTLANVAAQPGPGTSPDSGSAVTALQKQFEDAQDFRFEDGQNYEFEN